MPFIRAIPIVTPGGGGGGENQSFDEGTDTGTQWFVRPNGSTYGTGAGTSWTNAWSGFSGISWGSVSANDTIWIAGGTYTQALTPTASGTSGNPIKVRRARSDATQCTSASGWNASFDSQITQTNGGIFLDQTPDWIMVSGAKTQSGGNVLCDDGSCGWTIDFSAKLADNTITIWGSNNNAIRWIECVGAGQVNIHEDMRGVDMTRNNPLNNTIGHCWFHDLSEGATVVGGSGHVFEYCVFEDIAALNTNTIVPPATQEFHPNGIITWGTTDSIMRYCVMRKGPNGLCCGEGMFFEQAGGSTGWKIYGNVFHDLDNAFVKAIEITSEVGAVKIFNNTFVNVNNGTIYTSNSPSATSGEQRNNYVYNCGVSTVTGITNSNNVTATNTSQFVDYTARNLRIVAGANARDAGTALTSDGLINKDMDGNTRGSDGTWDCGAWEYV